MDTIRGPGGATADIGGVDVEDVQGLGIAAIIDSAAN